MALLPSGAHTSEHCSAFSRDFRDTEDPFRHNLDLDENLVTTSDDCSPVQNSSPHRAMKVASLAFVGVLLCVVAVVGVQKQLGVSASQPSMSNPHAQDVHGVEELDAMNDVDSKILADDLINGQHVNGVEELEPELEAMNDVDSKILADDLVNDQHTVPQLYSIGCEDTYSWTNGNARCSSDTGLLSLLSGSADKSSLCQPTGYTCAAYAKSGMCLSPWALGRKFNFPEKNCCACGGGTTVQQLSANCGEATPECKKSVDWAMSQGIDQYPTWYPGLSNSSSFDDFQHALAKNNVAGCQTPCGMKPGVAVGLSSGSEGFSQIANEKPKGCAHRAYDGPQKGNAFCFAQLASNAGVAGTKCSCSQGCDLDQILVASTNRTVTFRNAKSMPGSRGGCSTAVLLTSPRDYYKHYADMKELCGHEGLIDELEVILRDAFDAFNNKVCKSALWQCFHSPRTASVPYLHLQTFVDKGFFHAMPTTNHRLASCVKQEHRDESWDLAVKLASMM